MPAMKTDKKFWIGIGISLFFLVLLFGKIDFKQLAAAFREMHYAWLAPAVLMTFVSYFLRAVRWRYLLLPLKQTSMGNLVTSTFIGYMANNILPARLGEFVRAYALGQKERLETSAVFATLVLDRLFDGFTVLVILLFTFFTVKLPPGMTSVQQGLLAGGYVTLAVYVVAIVFIVLLKRSTARTLKVVGLMLKPFPSSVAERLIPLLGSFIAGLRLSTRPKDLAALLISSMAIWTFAVWSIDMVLRAFGIGLPITASMFIMVFLVFAVMVPAAPGFIGTYHTACVYGLLAFSIPKEKALSIALVMHGINFFPIILVGFLCLWHGKLSLRQISSSQLPGADQ